MSSDLIILNFIKTLPENQKLIYLLLRGYKKDLYELSDDETELRNVLSELYQTQINLSLNLKSETKNDLYSKAPESKSLNIIDKLAAVTIADKLLNEKLGNWASSLSDDDLEP